MSFKFNFDDSDSEDNHPLKKSKIDEHEKKNVLPFAEVIPDFLLDENVKISSYSFKDKSMIKCTHPAEDVTAGLPDTNEPKMISDLIPHVYEGGFKVWECSLDLIDYFIDQNINFDSKTVLELGCGAGLPGIYALMNSAKSVHFQDYNANVLREFTIPNVKLNVVDRLESVKFFSGDWSHFVEQDFQKYDVILSSETIYCPDNYEHLHGIFEKFLHPKGTCLLAAKTFYFGVGGGTRDFENFVKSRGVFCAGSIQTFTEGVHREVMLLKFNKTS